MPWCKKAPNNIIEQKLKNKNVMYIVQEWYPSHKNIEHKQQSTMKKKRSGQNIGHFEFWIYHEIPRRLFVFKAAKIKRPAPVFFKMSFLLLLQVKCCRYLWEDNLISFDKKFSDISNVKKYRETIEAYIHSNGYKTRKDDGKRNICLVENI